MVAKMKLIFPPTNTNMGRTIVCISRIENVFSGMICYKGHNQMLVFQQQ